MDDQVIFVSSCCSLNPAIDVGQAEGAFVFGLGYWLMEELKFDPKSGQLITNSTLVCIPVPVNPI